MFITTPKCSIEITEVNKTNVKLKYSAADLRQTDRVFVHIPVPAMYIDTFSFHNKSFDANHLCAFGNEVKAGEKVVVNGAEITLSQNVFLKYPVFAFNQYLQIQKPAKANAFILLTAERTYDKETVETDISVK